eukprot:TRINITY_DN3768_c0_g1_i1.p1 TRINITY_DN3768_c0_g1~~TRINITY_DN3768_c0_g1_i1.p1  ORF type:complete len:345 (-),score=74.34 TRINITY_DN3768_c0_g1_i1:84-1118(-)
MFGGWSITRMITSSARWATRGVLRLAAPPVASAALVRILALLSDSLSPVQQEHLRSVFRAAIEQYIDGHVDIAGLVRGIAVVVVDESEVDDFVNGVLATLSEDGFIAPASVNHNNNNNNNNNHVVPAASKVDFSSAYVDYFEYLTARDALNDRYFLDEDKTRSLPRLVAICTYSALKNHSSKPSVSSIAPKSEDLSSTVPRRSSSFSFLCDMAVSGGESFKQHLSPYISEYADQLPRIPKKEEFEPLRCPISFDDILDPRGRLMHGVSIIAEVVLVAEPEECKAGSVIGSSRSCHLPAESLNVENVHIFFFKTSSLTQWFQVGGHVNPLTRSHIHVESQVFEIS